MAAAFAALLVVVAALVASSACSLPPKSVPQLLLYHVEICAFCAVSVQKASHTPTAVLYSGVRYADWQKQVQAAWGLPVAAHAAFACCRSVHCRAHCGSWLLPSTSMFCWAATSEARRGRTRTVNIAVVGFYSMYRNPMGKDLTLSRGSWSDLSSWQWRVV